MHVGAPAAWVQPAGVTQSRNAASSNCQLARQRKPKRRKGKGISFLAELNFACDARSRTSK